MVKALSLANALVQLQARYHHCGEAASEECLSAATFVRTSRQSSVGHDTTTIGRPSPSTRTAWPAASKNTRRVSVNSMAQSIPHQ